MIHPPVLWDRRWPLAFVELKGGLTLPEDVIAFALQLEDRGMTLLADGETLKVRAAEGKPVLSESDQAFIRNRKHHLLAVAAYQAPI
jgi:hypothetical protein